MAVDGRINVRHEDVFTEPVYLLSVDSVDDFEKRKAKVEDPQERDKMTGLRLWSVSVLDPTAQQGRREIKVKIAADVQPVPPNGPMHPVEFEGLQVVPYLDQSRTRPRVGIAYRAAGLRPMRSASGSGSSSARASWRRP